MVMTTGSYPAALEGDNGLDGPKRSGGSSPTSSTKTEGSGSSYDKEFLAGQEKGYSPRKAMAAGIVKC